jgi:heptosyltransferase-1
VKKNVHRILIIRPSAIGDIVMASAMLPVLKKAYPDARISWVVEPHLVGLLKNHPAVEDVVPWPKAQWRHLARKFRWFRLGGEIIRFSKKLRQQKYDLALDCQGLLRSRFLTLLSGARRRLGFESKEPGKFFMTEVVTRGGHSERMSSEYRHLMEYLDLDPGPFGPSIQLGQEVFETTREALAEEGITGEFIVFAPFTTRPQKHWFDDRWVNLGQRLFQATGRPVIVLGGPGDRLHAERLCNQGGESFHNFSGSLTLEQSGILVRQCSLVIGVDTGLTHMGTAFSRPTVALFGSTCPYLETASPLTRVLYEPHPCSPCRRNPVCDNRFDCMAALDVDRVFAEAMDLLQENPS